MFEGSADIHKYNQLSAFSIGKILEESGKLSKNAQNLLGHKLEKLQSTLPLQVRIDKKNIEKRAEKILTGFDGHYSTLEDTIKVKFQTKHDARLFGIVCNNIRGDMIVLEMCIKEMRRCI